MSNTKFDSIINILKSHGMNEGNFDFSTSYNNWNKEKIQKASDGNSMCFEVRCENLGRCYNKYHTIMVNYNEKAKGPSSNFGEVAPKKTWQENGINLALFVYEVDSSD